MSTRTPRLIALFLTLFAGTALFAFAACGGDDNASATATGAAHNTNTATANPGSTKTDQATSKATDTPNSSDPFAALDNLTGDIKQPTGKVSYTSTSESGSVSTMTFYSKGSFSRTDQTDSAGATTTFVTNADGSFLCEASQQTCIGYGSGIGAGIGLGYASLFNVDTLAAYVAVAQAAGVNVEQSSETHAGIDSDCFAWTDNSDPTNPSTGKLCFGGDQKLLLYQEFGGANGTTKFEATAYSGDVSDSDFDTPYPVTTTIG